MGQPAKVLVPRPVWPGTVPSGSQAMQVPGCGRVCLCWQSWPCGEACVCVRVHLRASVHACLTGSLPLQGSFLLAARAACALLHSFSSSFIHSFHFLLLSHLLSLRPPDLRCACHSAVTCFQGLCVPPSLPCSGPSVPHRALRAAASCAGSGAAQEGMMIVQGRGPIGHLKMGMCLGKLLGHEGAPVPSRSRPGQFLESPGTGRLRTGDGPSGTSMGTGL